MPLDISKLVNYRPSSGGAHTAGCPACIEEGGDHSKNHLYISVDGRFGCLTHQGDKAHLRRIWQLAGDGNYFIPSYRKVIAGLVEKHSDKISKLT